MVLFLSLLVHGYLLNATGTILGHGKRKVKKIRCSLCSSRKGRLGCDGLGLVMSTGEDVTMGCHGRQGRNTYPKPAVREGFWRRCLYRET